MMASFLRLAVLGDPIDHSRSPAIQAAALTTAGIPGEYTAIRADRARLDQAIDQLRSGSLDGLNVTMPLKGDAYELSENLTHEAHGAGSVNTLRFGDGVVQGHSTDVVAFRDVLGQASSVLILGAGGSARAALAASRGRKVYLAARNGAKASGLASEFGVVSVPWGAPAQGALVVNATPLGMTAESLPAGVVEASAGLVDLPYGSATTSAVRTAVGMGIPTVDGFEFLARQAAESFRWWTGTAVDFQHLTEVARNA